VWTVPDGKNLVAQKSIALRFSKIPETGFSRGRVNAFIAKIKGY
jgi:hypothetical protein